MNVGDCFGGAENGHHNSGPKFMVRIETQFSSIHLIAQTNVEVDKNASWKAMVDIHP